jgi:hypothetical protein
MSYNIDTFKVKQLEDLTIPVPSLYAHPRKDLHPTKMFSEQNADWVRFQFMEHCFIEGSVIDGTIHVKSIDWCGEGSGNDMHDILEPALKNSTGVLIASCVWEGGDSLDQLRVDNGKVEWVDIEI